MKPASTGIPFLAKAVCALWILVQGCAIPTPTSTRSPTQDAPRNGPQSPVPTASGAPADVVLV